MVRQDVRRTNSTVHCSSFASLSYYSICTKGYILPCMMSTDLQYFISIVLMKRHHRQKLGRSNPIPQQIVLTYSIDTISNFFGKI